MNEATRILQMILEEQGYVVAAWTYNSRPAPRIGEVLSESMHGADGPFLVTELSTAEEYVSQCERAGFPSSHIARAVERSRAFIKVVAE